MCDFWVCSDVLCCTASILHLVGIALDRYWAVTNAEYIRKRTAKRIGFMIAVFWLLSVAISLPARFTVTRLTSWIQYENSVNNSVNDLVISDCGINKEYGYTIFSTVVAFYMPMFFIICIYARIYMVAKARIRRSTFRKHASSPTKQPGTKGVNHHNSTKSYDSSGSHWTNQYICIKCCRRTSNKLASDQWTDFEGIPTSAHAPKTALTKRNLETKSVEVSPPYFYKEKNNKSPSHNKSIREKNRNLRSETSWKQVTDVPKFRRISRQVTHQQDKITAEEEPNNGVSKLPGVLCVARPDRDRNASINITQCHQCFDSVIKDSAAEIEVFRLVLNRISQSAPPSVFGTPRPSYSSGSSTLDSSCCYTLNRSDKSDLAVWSSSCSMENQRKPADGQTNQTQKLYSVMKTLISYKQKVSSSPEPKRKESCHKNKPKNTKWSLHKLGRSRSNRADTRYLRKKSNMKKLSVSCCDAPQGNEDNNNYNNSFDAEVSKPIKQGIRGQTVIKPCQTLVTDVLETDDISGGTIHLEAGLKSTVCEVTKLATVTAMVKRERLENQRERKAVITLAIITGCFMLCWLPFFIVALTAPFYDRMRLSKVGQAIVLWLGYSNSLLNPIIYTIFSPDFRNAFRKILFGRYYLRYRDR